MAKSPREFAAEMHQAHAQLRQVLGEVEAALSGPSDRLATELERLLSIVDEHFDLEEKDGYMAPILEQSPQLEHQVKALLDEHRELDHRLRSLIEEARSATEVTPTLADGVRGWLKKIRSHEARENALVQDFYTQDIGTKD